MVYIAVDYMSMGYVLKESEMNLEEVCSVYTFRCQDVLIPLANPSTWTMIMAALYH